MAKKKKLQHLHGLWSTTDFEKPEDHARIVDHIKSDNHTEEDYINLLTNEYENADSHRHADVLFGKDPEAAKKEVEEKAGDEYYDRDGAWTKFKQSGKLADGILRDSPHNNEETNAKVLKILDKKATKERDYDDPDWNRRADTMTDYDAGGVRENILEHGKISKEDLARYAKDPHHAKHALANKAITKEVFDDIVKGLKPTEITADVAKHPEFTKEHARKALRSNMKVNRDVGQVLADRGHLQPKDAQRLLKEHSAEMSTPYMDKLLDHLTPEDRKAFLDEKLGITGGEHTEKRPELEGPEDWDEGTPQETIDRHNEGVKADQKEWDDNNWNNWTEGPGHDAKRGDMYAASRHITDDHAEHIKRHGDFDTKMALFENEAVDPKHGAEMWQKWDNDDDHHGYDISDWRDKYKKDMEDNGSWYEEFSDQAREEAESDYSLDDYLSDRRSWGRRGDDPYIWGKEDTEKYIQENPDKFNTMADNPDFDEKQPEHPEDNPRQINFADPYAHGGHSYELSDHPDYDDMMDDAEKHMRKTEQMPDHIYEGYDDAIRDSVDENARRLFNDSVENFHEDYSNLPKHLRGRIPGVEVRELHNRDETSKAALRQLNLDDPYSTESKHGYSELKHENLPKNHEYAPGLHHLKMMKDYADANGGKIDLGVLVKRHPNLKEKFKQAMGDKQVITSEEAQKKMDEMPKQKYNLSYRTWGSGLQNINGRDQLVVRLDHTPESKKQFEADPELHETYRKVSDLSQRSGHPTNKDSIAWSRVDTTDPKHWMIDEVQSDFGSALRRQIENAEEGDPATKEKLLGHLKTIEEAHKDWRENIMSAVIDMAKRHGVEKISTHSPESKQAHTGAENIHTVYKDSYQKVPRQLGFKPVESSELPLSEHGQRTFSRSMDEGPRFTEQELEGRTPDQHKMHLHRKAMEHHLHQAKIHEMMSNPQGSLFSQDEFMNAPADMKEVQADPETHQNLFNEHKRLFNEHKKKAMQLDPTDMYAKGVQFHERDTKDLHGSDFGAAKRAIQSKIAEPHEGDKLLVTGQMAKPHQGHQLDLRAESLKKSEEEETMGALLALRLLEIL